MSAFSPTAAVELPYLPAIGWIFRAWMYDICGYNDLLIDEGARRLRTLCAKEQWERSARSSSVMGGLRVGRQLYSMHLFFSLAFSSSTGSGGVGEI